MIDYTLLRIFIVAILGWLVGHLLCILPDKLFPKKKPFEAVIIPQNEMKCKCGAEARFYVEKDDSYKCVDCLFVC